MDSIIEAIRALTSPDQLIHLLAPLFSSWIGYALLFAIVFAETGLLVGFFLPGDSLLFLVGTVAGAGDLDILAVNAVLMTAAILGDTVGYTLGRQTGPRIFSRPDSRLFRREHLQRTHAFYEKHGGKTIIYARFVPIVRTFAPFVAGVGKMDYSRFLSFNIFGGIGWVFAMTMLGYGLGGIPIIKQHLEKVILLIIFLSVAPMLAEAVKAYRKAKAPV
ncbi:MAG TPA: VTT domain-containing protein [Bryobacteraceae bacterium]|jgi:membrane-associated protein|nr:VTT domain-containing protein [Bryobacteraceae bacterium]